MRNLLFLLLLLLLLLRSSKSTTHPGDITALKSLLQSLDPSSIPPNSCLSTWDFNLDPCLPSAPRFTCGLRCSAAANPTFSRITDLSLDPAGYSGPLPPSIWSLPFLQSLDISNNRFTGPIPPPPPNSSLPPLLRRISLSRNSFSGGIPSFNNAPALQELYLDGNDFSGEFPDLRSLSNLNFLDASDNSFSGPFASLLLPPSLFELSMRGNLFAGNLPGGFIASLADLQVLDLSHNELSGPVPAAAFEHASLQQLSLSGNAFEWVEQPAGGGGGSEMVALDLSRNKIRGLLPGFFGLMPRLAAVVLEDNLFNGLIPIQYAMRAAGVAVGWAPFERLLLGGNYLYGPIPGLMEVMKEGVARISLADNCLFRCPEYLYFCAGGEQKPETVCREFNPMIP